uniref:Uncharacterized protein n=1 Tax=viral metagenome TaxID=1070528 RepID=A0A6H1ZK39_9ZZZZ
MNIENIAKFFRENGYSISFAYRTDGVGNNNRGWRWAASIYKIGENRAFKRRNARNLSDVIDKITSVIVNAAEE